MVPLNHTYVLKLNSVLLPRINPLQPCSGPLDARLTALCLSPCLVSQLVHWFLCEGNPALRLAKPTLLLKTFFAENPTPALQSGG